jgi:hypothetical protein
MQRLQIQLLRGRGRHELHRRALHGFGNRFVLLVFGAPLPASLAGGEGARPDHPINGNGVPSVTRANEEPEELR